ncbi:Nod1 [Symbiodinium natans]|uniref:Nod1 protein n=1 Tax=Symbiodinium natans TaxID=878477 RepID=A0A812LEW5_9DINO|nr:Nod1 [Symbiodinium natans]
MAPKGKMLAKAKAKPEATPRPWPPKVPMGPIEDVLPLIADDDESLDTLILPPPGLLDGVDLHFGPEEMEYVCQCLEKNTTVTQLNASMSAIGDAGAKHIAALLDKDDKGTKGTIARLSLNGCGIGSEGARALADGLARSDVMVVELTSNRIDDAGGKALLEALRQNKKLRELKLSFNPISQEIEAEIERALLLR